VAEDAPDAWKGVYRVKRKIDRSLTCSILIFYKGDRACLCRLLNSIKEHIPPESREVVVCGRDALPPDFRESLYPSHDTFQWIGVDGDTIPAAFNEGANQAKGDLLFFLTDDFELFDGESYFGLAEQAQREEVGAAGGRVYYANGLVEHGGVIFGPFDILGYAHRATPDTPGYAGLKHMIGNFSAVMGYGLMTRRALFVEIGGFDAEFNTAYWDADYCLRLGERGYRITYTPYSRLKHHIPVPLLSEMVVEPDATRFRARWRKVIDRDPFFNPNFSRQLESFEY
jgi:GT2 family glycosyltransferase